MVPRFAFVTTLLLASLFCVGHAHPFGLISGMVKSAVNTASTVTTGALNTASSVTTGALNTATSLTTGVVDTTKKVANGAINTANSVTNSVTDTTKKVTNTAVNIGDTLTLGAVSKVKETVSSTVEKTTNKDYYTVKYAFSIYSKCYRSCLMYLLDDEKRDACAAERETYCEKVKKYNLQEALGVVATKAVTKSALNSLTSSIPLIG